MIELSDWPEFRSKRWSEQWPTSSGVYVVQFPDRVKIGKAHTMRSRINEHRKGGATRAVALAVRNPELVERRALRVMRRIADQIDGTESFTGITFEQAEGVLAAMAERHNYGEPPEILLAWNGVPV